jgi:predicted nucleotide-binding protein (sugar kinase/HSP70/actin superfamily)
VYTAYHQLAALDRAEAVARRLRAFERVHGTADRLVDGHMARVSQTHELRTIRRLEREFLDEAATVETEDTQPLRVRVAGEIWVILEQAATRDVERWLGARARPRVWVDRQHSASAWFQVHVLQMGAAVRRERCVAEAAHPWLTQKVGGHGQLTVGQVALAPREGLDGVLHIFPFTCMPEIIAQNIIVRISEELDIPVLTYIVSEQMGEVGMETRLEAFLDLLEERRLAGRLAPALA